MSDHQDKLLPGGYLHLLFIVQWVVELHLFQIFEAARGNLAFGIGAPSEDEAVEAVLRIFQMSYLEADRELIERYMAARTRAWWQNYPERELLSDLVVKADRRKNHWAGLDDQKRTPTRCEGLRIARPLLSAIPKKISLDAAGEFDSMSRLLAAIPLPPMGEPTPEEIQRLTLLAQSVPVYSNAVMHFNANLHNATAPLYRPDIRWQKRSGIMYRRYRKRVNVQTGRPVRPAIFVRNLHVQFVVGFLDRLDIPPRGKEVSGCRIVGELLGLSEDGVKRIWEMPFTVEMKRQSRAVAERLELSDITEA